jgi:acyl-coenzyme A synthetase/AMP-(fatty) acid ligase
VPHLVIRSPDEFLELLVREQVTVLNQTPSAFRQLSWAEGQRHERADLRLRYVIFGGEALGLESLEPWFERHGDERPTLVNMYGITETTVHVTYRVIRRADLARGLGSVIGRPIPDLRLYLLNEKLQPVPPGVPGEIFVGGAGVARGYLNRPELTAERFLRDPFSNAPGARLYRSGDLARYTAQGELEYLGRKDGQVKLRGFRVELGEIESVLNRHGAVRESVVLAQADESGGKRLVAYVVGTEAGITGEQLREFVSHRLPDYMVPASFVWLERLPLTANGKVDRRALAQAELPPPPEKSNQPPRDKIERLVSDIWRQVLGRGPVGVESNFFHLGGHSLLATQVIARLAATLGLELSVRLIFEFPTVAGLAGALRQIQAEQPAGGAAIPRRRQEAEAQDLLSRIEQLSAEEVDEILGQPGAHTLSA